MHNVILERLTNVEEVRVDIFSKLLQNRVIFIDDLISDRAAMDIVAALFHLDSENNDKITLFINSEGGDIRNIFAIYDAMQIITSPLETFGIGSVMKEAVLLLAAGTKGFRLITRNADVCLSQVTLQYMNYSDLTDTKISHEKTIKDNDNFLKALSKNINKPLKDLKKDTERQLFMTSNEAIKYGLADKIM